MYGPLVRLSLVLVLILAVLSGLSCGGGSNRVLESISVSPQVASGQVQFVATGRFSAPPLTVTPLPVTWSIPPYAMPATVPTIDAQGLSECGTSQLTVPITASAPANPKLPLNSPGVAMVTGKAQLICP